MPCVLWRLWNEITQGVTFFKHVSPAVKKP